ncbi:MAG: recA protein [Pseudobdellovibrionaceae bacterium]
MSKIEKSREAELNFDSDFPSVFDGNAALSYDWETDSRETQAPVAVEKPEDSVDEEMSVEELKDKLSPSLIPLHQLKPPAGLATGIDVIDDFLLWHGFPQGDLTLLSGPPGTGATSLWIQTAVKVQEQKKWVAWINSDWELLPSSLVHKKINLQKLLVVRKPTDSAQLFWILQEMITSSLFEMVGCHLSEGCLKTHQLQKLKKLARTHQVALVFITHSQHWMHSSLFSLVIDCQGDFFTIKRAAHRPTPFTIPGGLVHADLMSQLTADTRSLLR